MILTETSPVPDAALPLAPFKAHLRLGTGFGEEGLQDEVLLVFLRAALSAIEARIGKALLTRGFVLTLEAWRDGAGQVVPLAPVSALDSLVQVAADGTETVLSPDLVRLRTDMHSTRLMPVGAHLPQIPAGGAIRVALSAGMAADWGALPADLAQAVLLLAAHYYDNRAETALGDGCMPFGVTSLIQRYRTVRLGFGGLK